MKHKQISLTFQDRFPTLNEKALHRAYGFLRKIGVSEGQSVVGIGVHVEAELCYAVSKLMKASFNGFELNDGFYNRIKDNIGSYFDKTLSVYLGEFSSGITSMSKVPSDSMIESDSQDVVLAMSGVFSDPFPESSCMEVLTKTIRVIKPGGKLIAGTLGIWNGSGMEKPIAESNFQTILLKKAFRGVKITEAIGGEWQFEGKGVPLFEGDTYIIDK